MKFSHNVKHRSKVAIVSLASFLLVTAAPHMFAKGSSSSGGGSHTLGGSTTVDPIMQLAIEGFRQKNPSYAISYDGVGSSNGIKGALSGSYELGGSSRELKDSEISAGVEKVAIARDGIAVVTHTSTAVTGLSTEQVHDIFTGKITNWKQVGGADAAIVVLIREESSGTRASFDELALDKEAPLSSALVVVSNGDMALKLSSTPNSVGYIGLGYVHQLQSTATPITIDGHFATEEEIAAGNYPLSRSLYLVYKGALEGFRKQFVDYLLSDEGQDYVAEAGFLPLQ